VLAILPGIAADQRETLAPIVSAINRAVDEETAALGGSISAEHGIGIANKERLNHVTAPREMALLRQVKGLLDPQGLMNPGKVLSD
jgi:FAD/FMN-containing dehydrogenase